MTGARSGVLSEVVLVATVSTASRLVPLATAGASLPWSRPAVVVAVAVLVVAVWGMLVAAAVTEIGASRLSSSRPRPASLLEVALGTVSWISLASAPEVGGRWRHQAVATTTGRDGS